MSEPNRGDVWVAYVGAVRGSESVGTRPVLIVSEWTLHREAGTMIVLPLTTAALGIACHVPLHPPEGGVQSSSFVMCEYIRAVAVKSLLRRCGQVDDATMMEVEAWLAELLGIRHGRFR